MGGRSHHASDGSAVSDVGIGIEDHLADAGSCFAVLDLGDRLVAKRFTNGFVSDHRDGLPVGVGSRNEGGGRTSEMDL